MADKLTPRQRVKMAEMRDALKAAGDPRANDRDFLIKRIKMMSPSGPKKMKEGGAVPAEFKGFSKLPEKVQQKMNPDLAQKYENGGEVRGARSAISGRGFKGIR